MSSRSNSFDRSNSIDSRSWSIGSSEFIIDEPEYLLEQNKIKRDNLRKSLEQDVSDKQVNTVLTNLKLK